MEILHLRIEKKYLLSEMQLHVIFDVTIGN